MSKLNTLTKHLPLPLGNIEFEDPTLKLEKLFSTSSPYESFKNKKKYIRDLISVLESNQEYLAKFQEDETGKPASEGKNEIRSTVDFLTNLKLHLIQDAPRDLLVLAHFTDPIMTSCIAIAYSVLTRSKALIHPSTKAARTMMKLYSLLPKNDQWEMVFCDQDSVDEFLIKDPRFFRIYVDAYEDIFNKIKDKSAGQEIVGQKYNDQVLVVDSKSDLEKIISAFMDQFFLFATRYGVRLNKILVEDLIYNDTVELLKTRLYERLSNVDQEDVVESFSRKLPSYKVERIKELILEALAAGAEVEFGSVTEQVDSPMLLTNLNSTMEIFSANYWEPVILLVPFKKGDFPSVVRSLDSETLYIGNQYSVSWMKEKYYEANTSTIIGINNSPEYIWEILMN